LSDDERRRAIELLEANHDFPTDYALSVIAFNRVEVQALILSAAAVELPAPDATPGHAVRPSSGGKYLSHHLTVRCADAEQVLRLCARLRAIDGVVTIL
jgi:putative lipoic acid-binding regulatory protein